jgi:hypothetical protein
MSIPFDQRACFIAGQAKSGTTLLVSLLDGHPELLVFPLETAYFPTVLTKYGNAGRRAQFDYLTKESFAKVLFGGTPRPGKHDYTKFPQQRFLEEFERVAFDPANAGRDLLVLMVETYAKTLSIPPDQVKRWVEKTPANRNCIKQIQQRFPDAKFLITLRDPRAILAAQIALEKRRQTNRFSVYYVIAHWRIAAKLAKQCERGELPGCVVAYEKLVTNPSAEMQRVCEFLEITFDADVVLNPTKVGEPWSGNSAAGGSFSEISAEPSTRWERDLSKEEIGWVEWHCGDLMPDFGYEPRLAEHSLRDWVTPVRGERPKEYLKSRAYSLRDRIAK